MKDKNIKVINHVEKIRRLNNKNWMNLLRLAFKKSPKQAAKIMSQIYKDDHSISRLVKKLSN